VSLAATVHLFEARVQITVTSETPQELIKHLSLFSTIPTVCPICGSELHFLYKNNEHEFYGVECAGDPSNPKITHSTLFGTFKDGKALFYKPNEPWVWYDHANKEEVKFWPKAPKSQQDTPPVKADEPVTREMVQGFLDGLKERGIDPAKVRPIIQRYAPEAMKLTKMQLARVIQEANKIR
jgi:hypothetical protein